MTIINSSHRLRIYTIITVPSTPLREHISYPGLSLHGRTPSYGLESCQEQGTGASVTTILAQSNRRLWRCLVDPLWLHVNGTMANQIKITKNIDSVLVRERESATIILLCGAPASDRRVETHAKGKWKALIMPWGEAIVWRGYSELPRSEVPYVILNGDPLIRGSELGNWDKC